MVSGGSVRLERRTSATSKKARGTITGTSECPVPDSSQTADFDVPVVLRDESGEVVVEAVLHSRVGPKKKR